jgi:hypothetical protein
MHCLRNAHSRRLRAVFRNGLIACCIALSALLPVPAAPSSGDSGFRVRSADLRLEQGVYLLNASIDFDFSRESIEAMENGVTLTVLLDMEVLKQSALWDRKILERQIRFQVGIHALSKKYLVKDLDSGESRSYRSFEEMAAALGVIDDMRLLDGASLESDVVYRARLRARLDIEALPSPLRPLAYISPSWHLRGEWYEWPLARISHQAAPN